MNNKLYVIGLDFGTDSLRAVLVDSSDGNVVASQVSWYIRWKDGLYCKPRDNQYRQHPTDHIEAIEETICSVMAKSGVPADQVKGICVDTTGSSPIAVDGKGEPLCFSKEFKDNPNAMVVLWKDHTAIDEAKEINTISRSWGGTDFTKFEGGIYSSEWFWAKILHIIRSDKKIKEAAYTWMEHCDLITYMLIGSPGLKDFKRSRCAAGHKAMWHEDWGGLPQDEYLKKLDPSFPALKRQLYSETYTSDQVAGKLSEEWADKLGLNTDTVVSVGTFDAHAGAVGAEVEEHTLVRVMGTSTCDIIVASKNVVGDNTIRGICGQVNGSVIPGMIGLEAGQSAFGDLLAWFTDMLSWPIDTYFANNTDINPEYIEKVKGDMIKQLSESAAKVPLSNRMPLALDWINGRRTPDADQSLRAALVNLNLGTKAPEIFRALVESICFGSRMIIDRFEDEGVRINSVVGIGGVAKKSSFIMQTLANVLKKPIKVANSEQAPALGAAMYAATASAIYSDLGEAIKAMGNGFEITYHPQPDFTDHYDKLFAKYKLLGHFTENQLNQDDVKI